MIAALALCLAQLGGTDDVTEALAEGRHQLAMAAAARLEPGPRQVAEAEVLYQARSYDEALWKVEEALELGVTPDCTLLSRGVSSAIWVGDQTAGTELLARLEGAVEELPEDQRGAWRDHAADLEGYLYDLELRSSATGSARWRSQATAAGIGLAALAVLLLGVRSWRDA